ncbi:MAG: HEAT repeat domain-containing protein, partial [Planctomycetota bacterium]|nr:HEAT repeat domain-containing protein [Planctomycetota bacterium]
GNREELIGEIERIRELARHPDAEVRRTAIWALGRSGQLKDADLLINALQDFNVDVLVEANNSLCYLSRKIDGVGIPTSPFDDLPEDATEAQRNTALDPWKKEALARWKAWYIRVRPYKDRNDLFELGLSNSR